MRLSSDESFHFEILRILAQATYRGSDVGEVLATASEIIPGDFESFSSEWAKRAERIVSQSKALTNPISIRDAMFRAATYFRAADFYLHGNWDDPRIQYFWSEQTKCFDRALELLSIPGVRSKVPAKGFDIPIIFFAASTDNTQKRPTIILGSGYDGAMEEAYHNYGPGALERGWNVVCYEGPGQIFTRRDQGIGFVHNWETVVTPLLDYLEKDTRVDSSKIGLLGASMAGLLAARAAAFDSRIAAVFSIDGLYDLTQTPVFSPTHGLRAFSNLDPSAVQEIINDREKPTTLRWALSHGLWAFNVKTVPEYLKKAGKFSLEGLADKIKCPVFVGDAADDHFFKGQPQAMEEAIGPNATRVVFTSDDAAGEHCHAGATLFLNQVLFDWFEKTVISK